MKAKPFPERIQNIKEKFTTLKITTLCHKPGERGVRNGYVIVYAYFVRTATANNRATRRPAAAELRSVLTNILRMHLN